MNLKMVLDTKKKTFCQIFCITMKIKANLNLPNKKKITIKNIILKLYIIINQKRKKFQKKNL